MQTIVITGVSSGIGLSTARLLTGRGVRVFGSVRRAEDAKRLSQELGALFAPLLFDVTDEAAVLQAAGEVRAALQGETLMGLVNNAGTGIAAPLELIPIADFRKQIEINLTGQLIVTQAFLPMLGTDSSSRGAPGRIVNVSSTSGKSGAPFNGPYVASKHALEGLSESLRRELIPFGIEVIIVAPGFIATPIWDKVEEIDIQPYAGTVYHAAAIKAKEYYLEHGRKGLPAEHVAEVIWKALSAKKPQLRYVVLPNPLMGWIFTNLLPRRLVDRLIADRFGLKRRLR